MNEAEHYVTPYRRDEHLAQVRAECEASLRRLNTDVIDLYQLHVWDYPIEKVPAMVELLESLVSEGKNPLLRLEYELSRGCTSLC